MSMFSSGMLHGTLVSWNRTLGRFQKVFSAELADIHLSFNCGLTNSLFLAFRDDVSTDGIVWSGFGDLSLDLVLEELTAI